LINILNNRENRCDDSVT